MVTKYITDFYFDKAQYKIGEGAYLAIDYANKSFKIKGKVSDKIKEEANNIARDLLSRKHGVNFAERN